MKILCLITSYTLMQFNLLAGDEQFNKMSTLKVVVDKDKHHMDFNWTTLTEVGADYYTIERRINDSTFSEVTTLAALGFSNSVLAYNTSLDTILKGINFYRVKLTDVNGQVSYTDWEMVKIENKLLVPFKSSFFLQHFAPSPASAPDKSATIVFYDVNGKMLEDRKYNAADNLTEKTIPAGAVSFKIKRGDDIVMEGKLAVIMK